MWLYCAQKWILSENLVLFVNALQINTWTYTQIHTPTVVQRGGGEVDRTPPHQQDEVYFMGGGAAGGPSRHQQWSPSGLCQELEIRLKPQETDIFLVLGHLKQYRIKHFVSFYPPPLLLLLKGVEKTCIFTQKWLDQLLLMTSYLMTVVADHH